MVLPHQFCDFNPGSRANDATTTRSQSISEREVVLISGCRNGTAVTMMSIAIATTAQVSITLLVNTPSLRSGNVMDLVLNTRKMCVSIHAAKATVCACTVSLVI